VIMRAEKLHPVVAGIRGGLVGAVLMPIPAILWSLINRHGLWYPVNLLAGMVVSDVGQRPAAEFEQFHANWLLAALAMHFVLSMSIGVLLALVEAKLPV